MTMVNALNINATVGLFFKDWVEIREGEELEYEVSLHEDADLDKVRTPERPYCLFTLVGVSENQQQQRFGESVGSGPLPIGYPLVKRENHPLVGRLFTRVLPRIPRISQDLRVTLVWTDPPASVGSTEALIHDLDLTVIAQSTGTEYYPNGLDEADGVNNVERVVITDTTEGETYTIRVCHGF